MVDEVRLVHNLPAFQKHLQDIGKKFGVRAVRQANSAAARVYKPSVISHAPLVKPENIKRGKRPTIPGLLRRAIYFKRLPRPSPGTERYVVGVRAGAKAARTNRDAYYWRFLEGGWLPRGGKGKIGGGKRLRKLRRTRLLAAGGQEVSYPFILPAFRSTGNKALTAFLTTMDKKLAEISKEKTPK